jgi:hypothetical protein
MEDVLNAFYILVFENPVGGKRTRLRVVQACMKTDLKTVTT